MSDSEVEVHSGSTNVFADLGVADAEEMLVKSGIVVELRRLMRSRALTQSATAELVGMGQADLSKLLGGSLRGYSVERLMRMLTAFDQDVQIVSRPHGSGGAAKITFTPQTGAMSLEG